jgi:hypothetical protein
MEHIICSSFIYHFPPNRDLVVREWVIIPAEKFKYCSEGIPKYIGKGKAVRPPGNVGHSLIGIQ